MVSFLSQLIEKMMSDTGTPMHDIAVVLPNRRARRRLLQGLSERNGHRPMFAPQIFPMEEFVGWLSGLKVADPVSQLLRLHSITRHFSGSLFEMRNLLSWGPVFLKDISDMDMQLQNVQSILTEYALAARFEIPFGKDEPSESDRERILFNELLSELYLQYRNLLKENGEAYEGMIYRECAENIASLSAKIPFKRILFAGFYALSPSELEIVRYLRDHFRTEVYFDVDPFYCHLNDSPVRTVRRETAFFVQRNCQKLNMDIQDLRFCENNYASVPKQVRINATSGNMRQIYSAVCEVERIKKEKMRLHRIAQDDLETVVDMSDTAVVLADENLLLPFLLACKTDHLLINATMGLPFSSTPVFALFQQALALYESSFALTPDGAAELSFSGETAEQLWNHELLRDDKPQNFYFPTVIRYSQLPFNEMFENVSKEKIARRLPDILRKFCDGALKRSTEPIYQSLWQETAHSLAKLSERFGSYFEPEEILDFPFAKYAVLKEISTVTITLQGNPDKGLQVMGLLETRLMDFKNVIMLSVNEGVLPKGITYDSLLPFDFKFKFDGQEALPNYLYQDQVYAYHFFRLLQRAEDVTLLYNSHSGTSMAERSRFIAQLEYEVKDQHLSEVIRIEHNQLDFDLHLPVLEPIEVKKTDEIMKKLENYVFSASSLQTYITCPLKFYFRHLAKIRETKVLTDRMEPYELGTVIHALYKRTLDKIIPAASDQFAAIIDADLVEVDKCACDEIRKLEGRKNLTDSDLEQGSWLINRRIIVETVTQYLKMAKQELTHSPWRITHNEMKTNLRYMVGQEGGGASFPVLLTGSFDRVQQWGDRVMILDYKTGKVEASSLYVKEEKKRKAEESAAEGVWAKEGAKAEKTAAERAVEKIFTDVKYEKLFQLVLYALMYDYGSGSQRPEAVEVGIVSTREVNKHNPNYIFYGSVLEDRNILANKSLLFKELDGLFLNIFHRDVPFLQTEDKKRCKNCEFLHLCGRQTATESRA